MIKFEMKLASIYKISERKKNSRRVAKKKNFTHLSRVRFNQKKKMAGSKEIWMDQLFLKF